MSKDKGQKSKVKMIIKLFTKNVSETHDLNNPTQGTQCGGENKPTENSVSERRDLYLNNKLSIVH